MLRKEFESAVEELEKTQTNLKMATQTLAEMQMKCDENDTLRQQLQEAEVNRFVEQIKQLVVIIMIIIIIIIIIIITIATTTITITIIIDNNNDINNNNNKDNNNNKNKVMQ